MTSAAFRKSVSPTMLIIMTDTAATPRRNTTRLTVDVSDDDYQMLRIVAATSGKGVTISSVVREMIHDYLERIQDEADLALVAERRADPRPLLSGSEVRARLAQSRLART